MTNSVSAEGHPAEPGDGRAGRWLKRAFAGFVLSFLLFQASHTVADPDLWGHVRFGRDIIEAGRIVQDDPYSYLTAGQRWINHEWLAELNFYLAYYHAGATGLVIFKTALAMLVYGLAYRRLCRAGLSPWTAGLLMLPVLATTLLGMSMLRPQMFTYLLFLLTLLVLDEAERGGFKWLWTMPLVMALWVNLHGGVLAGIAVLGVWCGVHLCWRWVRLSASPSPNSARPRASPTVTVIVGGLLSLVALLANPYGFELIAFLLRTATVPRPEVPEWHPISFGGMEDYVYLMMLVLGLGAIALSRRPRRPALLAVFLVTALLPWSAYRHVPLFALAFVVLAGEHLADLWSRWTAQSVDEALSLVTPPDEAKSLVYRKSALASWLLALGLAVGSVVLLALAVPHFRAIHLGPRHNVPYPTRAVALLKASGVKGNLVILYDWGEYALWHLDPNVKVSMDGRRETVYSDAIYAEDMAFRYGRPNWDAVLKRPETDMALVSKAFVSFQLMKGLGDWELVYEDPLCGLFARRNGAIADRLKRTPVPDLPFDGEGMTFP